MKNDKKKKCHLKLFKIIPSTYAGCQINIIVIAL